MKHQLTYGWNMESYVLCTRAMPESHTVVNLAKNLKAVFNEFYLIGKVDDMECTGALCP